MLVPESGRDSQSAWGPPCGEFISHISTFFFFNSRWLKNQAGNPMEAQSSENGSAK